MLLLLLAIPVWYYIFWISDYLKKRIDALDERVDTIIERPFDSEYELIKLLGRTDYENLDPQEKDIYIEIVRRFNDNKSFLTKHINGD